MLLYFRSGMSSWQLLIIIIFINSIEFINSTQLYVNVSLTAVWAENATTMAGLGNGTLGTASNALNYPRGITVANNILYVIDKSNNRMVMVDRISGTRIGIVGSAGSASTQFLNPYDVVNVGTSIYVLDSQNYRIQRYSLNGTNPTSLPQTGPYLRGFYLFIDKNSNIYVSLYYNHTIVRFLAGSTIPIIVAGSSGGGGTLPNQLWSPVGIYVDNSFTIYIADHQNHRVQMWTNGSSSGITVAGNGTAGPGLTQLGSPTSIIVDKNGYMYIGDEGNNRILRWKLGSTSGICIAACTGTTGANMDQLNSPSSIAFDNNGSLYVSDYNNHRVQKFQILYNQNQITSTSQTTLKATVRTSHLSSAVYTTSALVTTKVLTSTILSTFIPTTKMQSTLAPSTTLIQTTTPKSLITSPMSSTDNHVETSISSTLSAATVKSHLTSATTVPQTTSKSIMTSPISSTDNHVETSVSSTLSAATIQSHLTSAMTIPQTTILPQTTSKSIMTSRMSSTDNHAETSVSSTLSAATVQSHLNSATTVPQTTLSLQPVTTPTMLSSINHAETTKFSTISATTVAKSSLTSIVTSLQTISKSIMTSPMSSTNNHLQTAQHTNTLSTTIWSSTSQETSISSKMKLMTLADLLSTESSTPWIPINDTSTRASSNCSNAIISLWPSNPSIITPLEIERTQDFSISSTLHLHCLNFLAVIEQWTIEKCLNPSCSLTEQLELSSIQTTLGELFVPSRTLEYGIYQMNLAVKMSFSPQLISSAITYINIISSPIQVRLIQYGSSMIIRGKQQTLILDPGTFSIDPDEIYFNSSNWNYIYFCQIYDNGAMLAINQSLCFNNSSGNQIFWQYGSNYSQSSLIIYNGSLSSNQTYHFRVNLTNIRNSSAIYSGDLLVQIEDNISSTIIVKCLISTMCISKNEYEMINPTTQIALTSFCIDNCYHSSSNIQIEWNIYYGIYNLSNKSIQWIMYENKTQYINSWIYGINTSNITVIKDLLLTHPTIEYWRFEVIYSLNSMNSVGLISFKINSPPTNGTCLIYPLNGTITTLFTINCFNWFDSDSIKDYSFYTWTRYRPNRLMLAYNASTNFQVRMPIGDLNSTLLQIIVRVKDKYDCTTELDLSPISVIPDMDNIISLITTVSASGYRNEMTSNPLVQILYSGNQNDVCQLLTSISQILNIFAQQNLQSTINNNISAVSISVSPLTEDYLMINIHPWILFNNTFNFNYQLNTLATVQEYLMIFINNLTISTIDSAILQGSTLSQLTAMTNQLTRDALIIASTRCSELSRVLLNYAGIVPYDEVQIAATYIAQCASNVLTAVNAPLQERTTSLDLDTTRANAFPSDYDTDLESIWSNPNLFADGDDFSQETINKNRNLYYQKQMADIIDQQFEQTISIITNALNIYLNLEQSYLINTSSIILSLKKMTSDKVSYEMIQLNDNTQIWLPESLQFHSIVSLRCVQTPLAIVGNQPHAHMNLSNLLSITFLNAYGNEIPVHTIVDKPIEFFIPRDINLVVSSMIMQNVTSLINDPLLNNHQFNLHFINIIQININISVSIHFEMHPLNNTLGYMLIYKFDDIPQLNSSSNYIDGWSILCPNNSTNDNLLTYFINNKNTSEHQSIIFGIRELNSTEFRMYCINTSTDILITDRYFHFSSNYELRIFTSGCYYLDSNNNWQSDGLLVGSLTTHNRTQCFSTHLSTFASGFVVLPNPINWNYVFAHADFVQNKTIYLTLIFIIIIFLLLAIYARHLDNKDNQKLRVTMLLNNQQNETYFYQLLIFTGMRKNAGTTAKVHFTLSGDNQQTDDRILSNSAKKLFQRGSIDSFIFGVPKSLGLLNSLRIWHDNSGRDLSPSWFLKYIIVRDLQTMEKSYFICQQWLSLEKDDRKIERVLPVVNIEQMRALVYSLSEKAYYNLSDDHLWFSVFSRPLATKFTRVQRCVCCFVLLYTVMLLDILYYDQVQETNSQAKVDGFSIGSFYVTKQQILIGVTIDILMFIPSTLLVTFFRRIRQYRSSDRMSSVMDTISKIRTNQISNRTSTNVVRKKKRSMLLPWWCLFIAYGLSFLLIGGSIVLIIARGIEFGDTKIQKWLTSLIVGLFSSIFLSQPLKVIGFTIFFAILRSHRSKGNKKTHDFVNENEEFYLNGGEEDIHSTEKNISTADQSLTQVHILSETEGAEARKTELRDVQMWSIVRQLLFYSCFLGFLYAASYANQNPHSYEQVHHLRTFFLNPHNRTHNYLKISTIKEFWKWLEDSFVENIRAQSWYNGKLPQDLTGFLNDKSTRLIGWPVMRQLRIKSNSSTCRVPSLFRKLIQTCNDDYSLSNADYQSWFPGWKSMNNNISYSQSIENAFIYRSDNYDYDGYIYEFRGHLNEIKENLTTLHNLSWIDSKTRIIIMELTLYNPNIQLFTSVRFLIELFSTGGIFPQYDFQPINLNNQFEDVNSIIHAINKSIYMLFIIYFIFIEINSFIQLKKKYFYSIWSFIQWSIIISSWTGFGMYIWRLQEASRLRQFFHQTNGYKYISIQLAVYIDRLLTYLFGFCCFFGTLKILYFFRFHPRLSQFGKTLQYVQRDLFYFAWLFLIVFISFICLFYLLFFSKIGSCSDVYHTFQMLFEILLLKFKSKVLYETNPVYGSIAFILFIYFVVFVCFVMMISIINNGFRHMRKLGTNEDQDILLFIFFKLKRVLGIKPKNETKCRKNESSEHARPMKKLTDRTDQPAITLNKLENIPSQPLQLPTVPTTINKDIYVEDIE